MTTAPAAWNANAVNLGGGWYWLPWLGSYLIMSNGWIWHNVLGSIYPFPSTTDSSVYFWSDQRQNCIWTSATCWPYVMWMPPSPYAGKPEYINTELIQGVLFWADPNVAKGVNSTEGFASGDGVVGDLDTYRNLCCSTTAALGGNALTYFAAACAQNPSLMAGLISKAAGYGIHIHILVLTNTGDPWPSCGMDAFIASLAAGYANAGRTIYLASLESERSSLTNNIPCLQAIEASVRNHVGIGAEFWVGSQSQSFLQNVQANMKRAGAWKEQDPSLLANPLTSSTLPTMLAEVGQLNVPRVFGEAYGAPPIQRQWTGICKKLGYHMGSSQI